MEVTVGVLADYANVTAEGKLNIMGIFDRMKVPQLPAMHLDMQIVVRIEVQYAERDRPHPLEIVLHEPNGGVVFRIAGSFSADGGDPGEPILTNHVIRIAHLPLKVEGCHQFSVLINNEVKKQIRLYVDVVPPDPAQQTLIPGA